MEQHTKVASRHVGVNLISYGINLIDIYSAVIKLHTYVPISCLMY